MQFRKLKWRKKMKSIKEKAKKLKDKVSKRAESRESQIDKITNTTLEEQRREILNKGKKFKYPVQYSKNRLVGNASIIALLVWDLCCINYIKRKILANSSIASRLYHSQLQKLMAKLHFIAII